MGDATMNRHRQWIWTALLGFTFAAMAHGGTLHVSPTGNDAWSGQRPQVTPGRTDGPLASLAAARDAVRRLRAAAPDEPVNVLFAGGEYEITETVTFTPADSGTKSAPIRYLAMPGKQVVFRGGRRIKDWQAAGPGLYVADLPEVREGTWTFRQLFADNVRQTRARCPNVDPTDPRRKGFFYVAASKGGWGGVVGCIHNRGDWLKYSVEIPADGEYAFWIYYGAKNGGTEWQTFKMDGRTALIVDGGKPMPLSDLPDTGGWTPTRWGKGTVAKLTKGTHTLVWKNIQGGGLNIDAFALSDDPAWQPQGIKLKPPAKGRHMLVIQAEKATAVHGKQIQISMGGGDPKEFIYKPGDVKPEWAKAPGAEVHIFQSGSCRAFKEILSIENIDAKKHIVHVGGPETRANLRAGDRYFVENVRSELDAPGEWYLDEKAGKLYFMPRKPIGQMDVVAPAVCDVIRFEGTTDKPIRYVDFADFTFRFTDMTLNDGCVGYGIGSKGVLQWDHAQDCALVNCRFENCGRYALAATNCSRVAFRRCTVLDSAQGGVLLLDSDHCEVLDCTMERLGAVYKHIAGVYMSGHKASDNRVAHNLIRDSARYGISFKNAGFRNIVEANSLHDLCTETYDTGGIEVTQGNRTERSNSIIRGNLVENVIGYSSVYDKPTFLSWGIYLDSFAGGYIVENNLTIGSSHGVMIQGGQGNTLRNNIFVDGSNVQFTFPNFSGNCRDNEFRRNIVYWRDPKASFGRMGANLEKTLAADHNLWFRVGEPLAEDAGWLAWRKRGFDPHGRVADPLFRDPANGDYTLKPGSPALALGFQPIDLSQVGPRR
jgi:parallel beta-helix repeat protein